MSAGFGTYIADLEWEGSENVNHVCPFMCKWPSCSSVGATINCLCGRQVKFHIECTSTLDGSTTVCSVCNEESPVLTESKFSPLLVVASAVYSFTIYMTILSMCIIDNIVSEMCTNNHVAYFISCAIFCCIISYSMLESLRSVLVFRFITLILRMENVRGVPWIVVLVICFLASILIHGGHVIPNESGNIAMYDTLIELVYLANSIWALKWFRKSVCISPRPDESHLL